MPSQISWFWKTNVHQPQAGCPRSASVTVLGGSTPGRDHLDTHLWELWGTELTLLFSVERDEATEPVPWTLLVSPATRMPWLLAYSVPAMARGVLCVPALNPSLLQDTDVHGPPG